MSSASTWEEPQLFVDEEYPPSLLKYLLNRMITQFNAQGACIALYDEGRQRMRVRLHVRPRSVHRALPQGVRPRRTVYLGDEEAERPTDPFLQASRDAINAGTIEANRTNGTTHSAQNSEWHHATIPARPRFTDSQPIPALAPLTPPDELVEVPKQQCELFAVGNMYRADEDLIGMVWSLMEPRIISHNDYLALLHEQRISVPRMDVTPTSYFVIPVQESTLVDDMRGRGKRAQMLGVVVLYQTINAVVTPFQTVQRTEATQYAERIALYLQNDRLQRAQRRASLHLQRIQEISNVFPTNVKLSELIHTMHEFTSQVVHVSSLLITFYDRDTDKIYDVYAHRHDDLRENMIDQPMIATRHQRPVWWQIAQKEKRRLIFSPEIESDKAEIYAELLQGSWGNQREAQWFLLLPMKMFNRVVGSLCITSNRPNAFHEDEVQVLETMVQIVTVSLENVKLYERHKTLLNEGKQRETHLATLNSAFQSISSGLNVDQLLNSLVDSAAQLMNVELSVFFQFTSDEMSLVARAMYSPPSTNIFDDGSDLPNIGSLDRTTHTELISQIQIPYKGTILEQSAKETYFYLDSASIEDIAQRTEGGGRIFLQEMQLRQVLVVPVTHDATLMGFLAISAPDELRRFRPKDVGMLLAVCAQAAGAIRNAQLFAEREEAYAELQRLSTLKDEFLVTASHELRTPLSAINGYAALLKRQSGRISPQNILRYATKIGGAAQQLSDLMLSMTEASKIGIVDKKIDLKMGLVQLRMAADVAVGMLSINVEQELLFEVAPDMWVKGDPLRVRQVISNLLDNAAKYSPPDGKIVLTARTTDYAEIEALLPDDMKEHVAQKAQLESQVVLVRVIDEGEGITPEDQKNIFEKFVRAPRSLTTPVRGTGLGLYISRRYIEAMGGHLWLERSVVNEGSTLSFYLPQVPASEIPETPQEFDEREFTDEMPTT